jgi:hypothetical protein
MLPPMDPQTLQRMMAMMALKNPEMLAQRAAAAGLRPPQLPPAATPVSLPAGAPTAGPQPAPPVQSAGVSMQDYVQRGFDPMEFIGDHMMPDPNAQYRGPIGAAGLPSHTGAAGPAGVPAVPAPIVAPEPGPGNDLASAISAMGAIGAPSAAAMGQFPQAPAPRVGGGMNPQLLAIMQAMIGGARTAPPPTLGSLMGG